MRNMIATALLIVTAMTGVLAQISPERERARPHYRTGWEHMRVEAWPDAAAAFERAIDIDPQFEDAYYGLGRAYMGMKQFAQAIAAYSKCRDLYRGQAGRQFTSQQEAQRYRQDRITELDEIIRQYQSGPQTLQTQDRLRQLQEQRHQIQLRLMRGVNMSVSSGVPAFVSLALGSAYFRSGAMADAEREYKAALEEDPKSGETHNNLAVVYLMTDRIQDADKEVRAAEKAGFRVNPNLKADIEKRKKVS
jgi:tetratricopeptide (TPR) repeat protein